MRGVLLITIEGIGTGLVGAYGASLGATPALDALAARGIVLDQCFLDSQDLRQQLTSLATGRHALQTPSHAPNLWQLLTQAPQAARFLTDSSVAAEWAADVGCEEITFVQPPEVEQAANSTHESGLVALFANAAQELGDEDADGFVWIHSSGLKLPWDAPLALRAQFTDPEDPAPPCGVTPPQFEVTPHTDPDTIVGWGQVAAAQISMIDDCLAMLLAILDSRPDADDWACSILGLGGVPLGEHQHVGWGRPQLHGEELHCVAIVRPAPAVPIGWRRAELCQLPDMAATLRECCGVADEANTAWGRSLLAWIPSDIPARWHKEHTLAIVRTEHQLWLRAPAWSVVWEIDMATDLHALTNDNESRQVKLYVKPDDRWEVSEIADRCPQVVDVLSQHARALLTCLDANSREQVPELEEVLCELLR